MMARALRDACAVLADFHAQPGLARFQGQLRARRRGLGPALRIIALMRRLRIGVLILLWGGMLIWPGRWFSGGQARALYTVSLTANNTRALESIASAFDEGLVINAAPLPLATRLRIAAGMGALARVLRADGSRDPFVFLHQLMAATALACFAEDIARTRPRAVLAANDHSPPTVALYALARAQGLRSAYVQHGAVTEGFPPLRVDLAVLHNARSAELYARAAARRGDAPLPASAICFWPQIAAPLAPMRVPEPPFDICIALSLFADIPALTSLIDSLAERSDVASIRLSQHPRQHPDLGPVLEDRVTVLPRGMPAREIAGQVDLCLVANSSVALEYLHFGCPVLSLGPPVIVPDDYYGFVADGLIPRLDLAAAPGALAVPGFWDADWQGRFAQVNPLVEQDPETLRAICADRFRALLSP